ncbi:DUF2782 domain-containing protein [Thiolinea disciformis]|uniref:DUF2782 domain-containing protein n=1 Tax=Thiolinea disciformis TaxID=125614 RepID=UPI00037292A4|nr:DUF2782 domain-containing protein [Thiolinea disciformis]
MLYKGLVGMALLAITYTAQAEPGVTVEEETNGRVKVQTIQTQDRLGTLEERRVQAMYSEIRFTPAGSTGGYQLIDTDSTGSINNAHHDSDQLKIPSWKMFSW